MSDEVTGYAVKLNGELLLRTSSDRAEAAMVNGLVLVFGMPADQTGYMTTDQEVRNCWTLAQAAYPEKVVEIVRVLMREEVRYDVE